MAELPNLKGVATKDLVEKIGAGKFSAAYINWSRTMQLLRDHAPGWTIETVFSADGGMLHRAPIGGYLLFRMRHLDGTVTPEVPQAVMDYRNDAIEYDSITARDITDTHRRGSCLVLAYQTGLAHELWAKIALETGYPVADEQEIQQKKIEAGSTPTSSTVQATAVDAKASKKDFVDFAKELGLSEPAVKDLIVRVNENYDNGIKTLKSKNKEWILKMNEKFRASQF